jgi:hypothetical protein
MLDKEKIETTKEKKVTNISCPKLHKMSCTKVNNILCFSDVHHVGNFFVFYVKCVFPKIEKLEQQKGHFHLVFHKKMR